MKKVIINADDFGLVQGVNEGIIKAHREGILTSTTLMANMPGFDQAVEMAAANPDLGVGAHLNILRGQPVASSQDVESLLSKDNRFVPSVSRLFRKITLKRIKRDDIEREFRAQLEKILGSGIQISHMDSEKHIHMIRPIFRIVLELAKEYNIHKVRFVREYCISLRAGQTVKAFLISLSAASLRARMTDEGIRSPDRFHGICDSGQVTADKLEVMLRGVKDGVSEIMVHPGFLSQDMIELEKQIGPYYINKYREKELNALLDERWPKVIEDLGIQLINFNQL